MAMSFVSLSGPLQWQWDGGGLGSLNEMTLNLTCWQLHWSCRVSKSGSIRDQFVMHWKYECKNVDKVHLQEMLDNEMDDKK